MKHPSLFCTYQLLVSLEMTSVWVKSRWFYEGWMSYGTWHLYSGKGSFEFYEITIT